MPQRYAGVKNGRIKIISNQSFIHSSYQIIPISETLDQFSNDDLMSNYRFRNDKIIPFSGKVKAKDIKLAFITNIYQACGIATYAYNLLPSLLEQVGEYKIFAERNHLLPDLIQKWPITQCWERGQSTSELIKQVIDYDPDVIILNCEWGLFPDAKYLLSMLTQLSNYRIITILHSVFPEHQDKAICEAAFKEIIVHSEGAKKALEDKGIKSHIHILPHGCYAITNQSKLWNIYRSEHTFIQSGFGFQYKGMPTAIKATALLKPKYPDVFFTALVSESPFNKSGHQNYYDELMSLVEQLGVQENVAIIRGYQSDEIIDAYYRVNKIAVFPYESAAGHLVHGASGAIRLAASKGVATISSNIPHFDGFPSLRANNEQELAQQLDTLFANPSLYNQQVAKQNQFIESNSWDKIANQLIHLIEQGIDI